MGDTDKPVSSSMPTAGPVGRRLIESLQELLEARGLSHRRASAAMENLGRPIPPLGFSRLLDGKRRLDVDELVALAVLLGVTPNTLLFPRHVAADEVIEVTPEVRQRASIVWDWAAGKWPLPAEAPWPEGVALSFATTVVADFNEHTRPDFSPPEPKPFSPQEMLEALIWQIGEVGKDPSKWPDFRGRILRNFRICAIQLEELFATFDGQALADGSFTFDTEAALAAIRTATGLVRGPADTGTGSDAAFSVARSGAPGPSAPVTPHGAATSVNPLDPFSERGR